MQGLRKRANSEVRSAPEAQVNVELQGWFERQQWTMQRVESKAVWSRAAGRYLHTMTAKFTSDWIGCTPLGGAAFVETKAPGKRTNLTDGQRAYLLARIDSRAFAVCVDSVQMIDELFARWINLPPSIAKQYLISALPPVRRSHSRAGDGLNL